ncbi:hypothetical protein L2520_03790 [Limosilactobacillus vaginalis]|uniref:DUF1772 domain-containing protein n=1 Tax=Limosilactobacillus vaginalis TaxID=1633 RepID=A0ABT4K6M7_9LACO|nr:hypothetical protein [Limosilactobacillus vaginalis]MCZ3746545.1 hypothetical protein [Limosilactobacillus vaginalis]MCZ3751563.1 hypothetical protein [Limosilactobacillus vaginalis]MCZ3753249.1 hypothetical protein [Limosilactobacillus vaginalis]MCZ3755065.1 hypothetical protein [Limosilactobacillus vaginalis]MCZ3756735.1 hypothetical protein [Limosilactobacillus vaginalis]
MIRITFLVILFLIQTYGLFNSIRLWIEPSLTVRAVKNANSKEAKVIGAYATFAMGIVYATTFILCARILPNRNMTMAFLVLAAIEIFLIVPRLNQINRDYSGTIDEQIEKNIKRVTSYKSVLSFIFNLIETVIIANGLYLIFVGGVIND